MKIETEAIWNKLSSELYFFILKRVKNKNIADEVLQNSFLKIHRNLQTLQNPEKVKAWVFQITRNEISNFFKDETKMIPGLNSESVTTSEKYEEICCFDRFIQNLPQEYNEVMEVVYIQGKKQHEAAELIGISLANVKARIRRAKAILKKNFNECCKFDLNKDGKLIGESNCTSCT
jgi:RNA polymerase sigma-70 factor (ECF subfamily)